MYCRLNLQKASVFNFEHLDILGDSIGYLSDKLFYILFACNFHFNFECLDILQESIRYRSTKLLSFEFVRIFHF